MVRMFEYGIEYAIERIESEIYSSEVGETIIAEDMVGKLRDILEQLKGE